MTIQSIGTNLNQIVDSQAMGREKQQLSQLTSANTNALKAGEDPLREAFHDFVGQTFFGQLLASLRSTQGEAAYFNGGRTEEIFRGQLDQVLAEKMSDASAAEIADPMYDLFRLPRS